MPNALVTHSTHLDESHLESRDRSPRDIAGARPESGSERCHSPGISARRAVRDRTIGPDIRGHKCSPGAREELAVSEHPPEAMKSTVSPKDQDPRADGSQLDQPLISTFPHPPNDINWGDRECERHSDWGLVSEEFWADA